ncbi:MAG: MBL fold metallo-hydrolase [Bacteroidales bacterium]|nr:MBL fold metallo-hydrolase [Bacteroidales bacterium]
MGTITIRTFHFNPIMVNTMVLHDDTREAIIVDPGNCSSYEDAQLQQYIDDNQLTVKYIVNTHPHVDHIAGNRWCTQTYKAPLCCHEAGMSIYNQAHAYAVAFGLQLDDMPQPDKFLHEGDEIRFGNQILEVLYTPGHCEGSICLHHPTEKFVLCGDLIFEGSVGRSDLPTGNGAIMLQMIKNKILTLDESTVLYPGHGGTTTVDFEKMNNPFLV